MYQGPLFTIKNTSDQEVVDVYDSIEYRFPAGDTVTLPRPLGTFFLDRHRDSLVLTGEAHGRIREPQDRQVDVYNVSREAITEYWDDAEYLFEPGKSLSLDENVARIFMDKHPDALKNEPGVPAPAPEPSMGAIPESPQSANAPLPSPTPRRKKSAKPKITNPE